MDKNHLYSDFQTKNKRDYVHSLLFISLIEELLANQGHLCKISVRRSENCLEISIDQKTLKILDEFSYQLTSLRLSEVGFFIFHSPNLVIVCEKKNWP